jgi:hypothetical protein
MAQFDHRPHWGQSKKCKFAIEGAIVKDEVGSRVEPVQSRIQLEDGGVVLDNDILGVTILLTSSVLKVGK